MQNAVKIKLIKLFFKNSSKKSILVDRIWRSDKKIYKDIISIWINNLYLGELKNLISDKIPNIKIQNKKNNSKKFEKKLKKIIDVNIT